MDNDGSKLMQFVVLGIAAVLLIVVGALAWMVFGQKDDTNSEASTNTTSDDAGSRDSTADKVAAADSVEIVFTDDGFEKTSYKVKSGGEVTVKNNSSSELQFSSDDHPSHHDNEELNLTVLAAGESSTFTPESSGTWGIHDHLRSQFTSTLTVE